MNKRETHIVTGMTRDVSASRFDGKFVVDARNIRITPMKDNSTLLSVTNEKGTGELPVSGSIKGTIVGHAILNNTLVLFTTEHTVHTDLNPIPDGNGFDRIYRVDFSSDFSTQRLWKASSTTHSRTVTPTLLSASGTRTVWPSFLLWWTAHLARRSSLLRLTL